MCGGVPTGTGKRPNLLPLTLTLLLTDPTRSKRSLGFVTQTRAGLMTQDPRGEDVVANPRAARRMKGTQVG